jgi:hypothetical protein
MKLLLNNLKKLIFKTGSGDDDGQTPSPLLQLQLLMHHFVIHTVCKDHLEGMVLQRSFHRYPFLCGGGIHAWCKCNLDWTGKHGDGVCYRVILAHCTDVWLSDAWLTDV